MDTELIEYTKKDFLIKTEIYSDKFFISDDILRVYLKGTPLNVNEP